MQPLKTKTCWELSCLFVSFLFSLSDAEKEGETTFRSVFTKILLVVVFFIVVYSNTNFISVRMAASTALNFACACNFPHSSRDLLGEHTGETIGRVEADEAMPCWCTSGKIIKSERLATGSRSPATKKKASLTRSCPPAPTTNTSNSEARIEPTINIGNLRCSGGSIVINLSLWLQHSQFQSCVPVSMISIHH